MDQQSSSPQTTETIEPTINTTEAQVAPTAPVAQSPTISEPQQPEAPSRSIDNATEASEVSFAGVDSSISKYFLRMWWLLALAAIATVGIFIFVQTIYVIIIPIIAFAVLKSRYENSLFSAFAKVNNYQYDKKGTPSSPLDGLVFSLGHSQKSSDVVSGQYKKWPFNLFMFNYTIGYGKGSHTYDRAIMNVDFDTKLPGFILKKHALMGAFESEGESFSSYGYSQKLSLEGDFDKHFIVHIRPNTQDDVLSVLTPDVMELLLGLDKYEIEMTDGGNFFIYCHSYINKVASLVDIYKILGAITKPIGSYAGVQKNLHANPDPAAVIVSPDTSAPAPIAQDNSAILQP